MIKKTEVLDHHCPTCGSIIFFNPKNGNWDCTYCQNSYTLEELKDKKNAGNIEKNKSLDEDKVDKYNDYFSYYCKDCGAEIITDEQTVATFCIHCGNTAILRNKLSGKFKPDKIIPFKKTKEDAKNAFKLLADKKSLIPKKFANEENIEKIRGVYVPFWFHDYKVDGEISFNGSIIEDWSNGGGYTQQTTIYDVKREGTVDFENIPTDGSTRYEDDLMKEIQPYDLSELKTYNHAYLSGFYAERFDVEDKKDEKLENEILFDAQSVLLHNFKKYSHIKVKKSNFKIDKHNAKYVLLPLYILNVKYEGVKYYFMMNGQTGEVVGKCPIDKKKTTVFVLSLFATIMTILTLIVLLSPPYNPLYSEYQSIGTHTFFLLGIISALFSTSIMFFKISEEIQPQINRKEYVKKKHFKLKNNIEKIVESYINETKI